jgi:hypothetical protein
MAKRAAIVLALIMLLVVAWGIFFEAGAVRILIDGQEVSGPLKGTIGVAGFVAGLTALFCASIFLLFVFAGAGVFILGFVIVAGLVVAAFVLPFLLVLLVPLAIVWAFIAFIRAAGS